MSDALQYLAIVVACGFIGFGIGAGIIVALNRIGVW